MALYFDIFTSRTATSAPARAMQPLKPKVEAV